jgi:hypothetical protein
VATGAGLTGSGAGAGATTGAGVEHALNTATVMAASRKLVLVFIEKLPNEILLWGHFLGVRLVSQPLCDIIEAFT